MKYTEKQIEALRQLYPSSDYESLEPFFPGKTKRQIMSIAHRYNIKSDNPGHRKDLIGQSFGRLSIVGIDHITEKHVVFWKCQCACGRITITTTSNLTRGKIKSCGCYIREILVEHSSKDHTGERFGLLTAVERLPHYNGGKKTYYRCFCECGNEVMVSGSSLVSGNTKTCGCLSKQPKAFKVATNPQYDDSSERYLVYKHVLPNGKVYIGITRQNVEKRWQNGLGYSTQQKFWRAIQKYGWEHIEHVILEKDLTEKQACEREEYYIDFYKSTDSKYGYNTNRGGTTGRPLVYPIVQYYRGEPVNFFESHRHAAEMLEVSVSTVRNYLHSCSLIDGYEFKEIGAMYLYDIGPSWYDCRNEDHLKIRDIIKQQLREKTVSRNESLCRPVCQYDMEGHFIRSYPSIKEAQASNPNAHNISAVLSTKKMNSKSSGGYQWRYDTGNHTDLEPLFVNGKAVYQIDVKTYQIVSAFQSMAVAERETGVKR